MQEKGATERPDDTRSGGGHAKKAASRHSPIQLRATHSRALDSRQWSVVHHHRIRISTSMGRFSCDRYFPATLEFTSEEQAQYVRLARGLVAEVLDEYAEYRTVPYNAHSSMPMSVSVVDPLEWKPVHRHGDLTVYKDRKKKSSTSSTSSSSHSSSSHNLLAPSSSQRRMHTQRLRRPDGGYTTVEAKARIPTLLVVGTFRGRLNDTMYGAFADSDQAFRVRTTYLDVELDDTKLLYTFESATLEEPFRFCGLLWAVNLKHVGIRRRDNVLLMATGMTTSKQGDRIGYTVVHSVDVPELRPLTQYKIERTYGSLVFVKRQLDEQTVEMFQKGFFTAMGDVPEFAITTALIRGMGRGGSATIEAALSKKLVWMMQDAARLRRQRCALSLSPPVVVHVVPLTTHGLYGLIGSQAAPTRMMTAQHWQW